MANLLNSSNSNNELSLVVNNNLSAGFSLSPDSGSNPSIAGLHPNEALSIIGGEPVNGVGQLGLSQRVTQLRRTTVTTKRMWVQGRTQYLPVRNHSALPAGEVGATENGKASSEILRAQLFCASSTRERLSTPNEVGDTENIMRASEILRAQLLYASSIRERLSTPNEVSNTESIVRASEILRAQLLYASSTRERLSTTNEVGDTDNIVRASEILRAQLLSASSTRERFSTPNEVGDSENVIARERLRDQLLYTSSIRERLSNGMSVRDPSLQNRSMPMQTRVDHPINEVQQFHNVFNYRNLISDNSSHSQNLICSPSHHSQSQPSQTRLTITNFDEPTNAQGNETLCPSPLTVYFPNETSNPSEGNNLQNLNLREIINERNRNKHPAPDEVDMVISPDEVDMVISTPDVVDMVISTPEVDMVISDDEIDSDDDGRTHSFPYKKNGPYTCPKCRKEFPTSQRFAAHVSSHHYKFETKAQKRKRLLAKIRRKSLRLQQSKYGLTFVPVPSEAVSATNSYAAMFAQCGEGTAVKVEVEGDPHGHDQVAPPGKAANGDGLTGVKIKVEPSE